MGDYALQAQSWHRPIASPDKYLRDLTPTEIAARRAFVEWQDGFAFVPTVANFISAWQRMTNGAEPSATTVADFRDVVTGYLHRGAIDDFDVDATGPNVARWAFHMNPTTFPSV